ncbi:MAG: DUF885 family protein [bacterium]
MIDPFSRFLDHYYRRRPVNATFTGMHVYDATLPDWSPSGLVSLEGELRTLLAQVNDLYPAPSSAREYRDDVDLLDAELIRAFCETQLSENASMHGMRGNPALWTGEAVFSIVALMIRDFGPLDDRIRAATERLKAIREFLDHARVALGERPIPAPWTARALRDCEGAALLFTAGVAQWMASGRHSPANEPPALAAATNAAVAFHDFADWLRTRGDAGQQAMACGAEHFDLLLARGHQSGRTRGALLDDARFQLDEACRALDTVAHDAGGPWSVVQEHLAADHPKADEYFATFEHQWRVCHRTALDANAVSWPDWPISFGEIPVWTREAAPYLDYPYYRSPAPLDPYDEYEYTIPPLPLGDATAYLRTWSHSTIKLCHVMHHAGIGHHLQNWHAYHRSNSRVGKIAAVRCANRIGVVCGETLAEGWACYATDVMEELGALLPRERAAAQHARVVRLVRAVVDLSLHDGSLSVEDAVALFVARAQMERAAARTEVSRCSMFPGSALSSWLGVQGIHDLRDALRERWGDGFSLKRFHDELLRFGSIPVPLIARLMLAEVA